MYQGRDLDLEGVPGLEAEQSSSTNNKLSTGKLLVGVLVGLLVAFFALSNGITTNGFKQTSETSFKSNKGTASTTLPYGGIFSIYKHTTSVPAGSYMNVSKFFSTYIAAPVDTYNLGCNETWKAVGRLTAPCSSGDYAGYIGFDEVHFVDSSVFPNKGLSITEWADYISSLGTDKFNTFMHNKLQMYVPDLTDHYQRLSEDGIDMILRASCSDGSGVLDTAHIGLFLPEAQNIYELVGPLSSLSWLTTDELAAFTSFTDEECPSAHQLPYRLDDYQRVFESATGSRSTSTGWYIPMGIAISTPTQSMEYISDTVNILANITGYGPDIIYGDTCDVVSIDFNNEKNNITFGPLVRYVANRAAKRGTTYTIADWEAQIKGTHDGILDPSLYYSKWDRYQDTHIGVAYNSNEADDDEECVVADSLLTSLKSSQQDPSFSYRMNHYYVGMEGIKSWEFHLKNHRCLSKLYPATYANTDICGCIADNNMAEYVEEMEMDMGNTSSSSSLSCVVPGFVTVGPM